MVIPVVGVQQKAIDKVGEGEQEFWGKSHRTEGCTTANDSCDHLDCAAAQMLKDR
jgi:hypothetical protein